jgi:hypothetical protein
MTWLFLSEFRLQVKGEKWKSDPAYRADSACFLDENRIE